MHGAENILFIADQADIDRVAGNTLRGQRHHRQRRETLLVFVMGPERRQHQIGGEGICDDREQREQQKALQSRMIA